MMHVHFLATKKAIGCNLYIYAGFNPFFECWVTCNKWHEPFVGRLACMVLRGFLGQKTNAYPTKSREIFIKYKMYLQALPYFDCLEGDYEVTK
jgi:hypothetical protein